MACCPTALQASLFMTLRSVPHAEFDSSTAIVEHPLNGGRVTSGVVRIGDTVRRPAKASSPFVASLLRALERRSFDRVPRYLGTDTAGRDVLSFIPGWVPERLRRFDDWQVAQAGELLRAFHDATRATGLSGRSPVVCHRDAGPYNVVFDDSGRPYAFIDFDTAAAGDPLEDVSYMGWLWCLSSRYSAPPPEGQGRQLRVLIDAYGLDKDVRGGLLDAIVTRQAENADFWKRCLVDPSATTATQQQIVERIHWSLRERAFVLTHSRRLGRQLGAVLTRGRAA